MIPPLGYEKAKKGQVYKLCSLYGLKQAGHQWNLELSMKLQLLGFDQSTTDYCLFVRNKAGSFIALLVYVDNLLITGNHEKGIAELKGKLHELFTIKDLGHARYFLGLEIIGKKEGMYINQRKYILDILTDVGLLGYKPTNVPFPRELKLSAEQGEPMSNPNRYRRLVGRLHYLNFTRPDISHAVQQLSQFVGSPTLLHWNAAIHVLRYLKGTPSKGLYFTANKNLQPLAYSDVGWASYLDTCCSMTGFCIF